MFNLYKESLDTSLTNILKNKSISGKDLEDLSIKFGERFWKSLRLVAERRVKQYIFTPSKRTMWIVVGKEKDYLILSDFYCSCKDFYLNSIIRQKSDFCYHLLGKILSKALNIYEHFEVQDSQFLKFMNEWKTNSPKKK